jgi:CRP-like cAMP-binding protein
MKKVSYSKGQLICGENTPGEEMYIVLSGSVRVYKTINAERIELAVLKRNDFFGELALLLSAPRTASVEAMEDTELLALTKEALLDKVREDPRFAGGLIMTMARRIKSANDIITRLEGEKFSLELIYRTRASSP